MITENTCDLGRRTIDERVQVSLAIQRYTRARDKFESASKEFNESCSEVRRVLLKPDKFVAVVSHQWFLVECDAEGNFEIEPVETV